MIDNERPALESTLTQQSSFKFVLIITIGCIGVLAVLAATIGFLITSPQSDSKTITLQIEKGETARDIADEAKKLGLVRSEILLYSVLTAFYDPTVIHAGRYEFKEPMTLFAVARKIALSEVDQLLVSLTLPEGIPVRKMAAIADAALPNFDPEIYLKKAIPNEGYVFPETYLVPENFTAEELYQLQSDTFVKMIRPLELAAPTSSLTAKEIVILASIIEREANDEQSMKMVAGILINRLEIDMPLQTDASIEYELDTPLNELAPGELARQLKEFDSPYNTYLYPGLPPTPISNPGAMAIEAALNPTKSDYFYYITGTDGNFYYAKTLNEHNENVYQHLR